MNSARRFTACLVNRSNAATARLYDMNDFRRLATHTAYTMYYIVDKILLYLNLCAL